MSLKELAKSWIKRNFTKEGLDKGYKVFLFGSVYKHGHSENDCDVLIYIQQRRYEKVSK